MPRLAEDLTSIEGHVVQFYVGEDELTSAVARFAAAGLTAGDGVLVVATPEHRASFEHALTDAGFDLDDLVAVDAAATLARVRGPDGRLDPDRFFDVIGGLVASASKLPGRHVRVFGEMVALLCAADDAPEAMALESLWNELALGPHRFTLLCAYPMPAMDEATGVDLYYDACGLHSAVGRHPDASLEAWKRFDDRATEIVRARGFVESTLVRWGFGHVAADATLVASELATNAVLHARSDFHVSIGVVAGRRVRVAVHDESPAVPRPRSYSLSSGAGRGLRLVDAVSVDWGTDRLPNRKAVWAELEELGEKSVDAASIDS